MIKVLVDGVKCTALVDLGGSWLFTNGLVCFLWRRQEMDVADAKILSSWKEESIWRVTLAYIDCIYINKDMVPVVHVRQHLANNDPEWLDYGT